jgi:hypothetical protein
MRRSDREGVTLDIDAGHAVVQSSGSFGAITVLGLKRIAVIAVATTVSAAAASNSTIVDREAPRVQAAASAVERDGTRLVLHLASGNTKTLTDGASCFDDPPVLQASKCYGFEFNRYDSARQVFVVERYYYEGASYLAIDARTGEEAVLQADPDFSPNGDVAVELVYGESGYYSGDPRMSVWRRRAGKFALEWSKPLADGGGGTAFSILGWRSNEEVDIEVVTFPSSSTDGGRRRFSIARAANGWQTIER